MGDGGTQAGQGAEAAARTESRRALEEAQGPHCTTPHRTWSAFGGKCTDQPARLRAPSIDRTTPSRSSEALQDGIQWSTDVDEKVTFPGLGWSF